MSERRKLTTIMAVDVAGYSRAAETDDGAAAQTVGRLRERIDAVIAPLGGRVFNTAGDGFMVEFASAAAGVAAAQALLADTAQHGLPRVRIGLHLGDVILAANDDLLGHGVNVAARLQVLAEPGTAVLSAPVQAQLSAEAKKALRPLGRVQLDKMSSRVEVFAIAPQGTHFGRVSWKRARPILIAAGVTAAVAIVGYAGWRTFASAPTSPVAAITALPRLAVLRFQSLGSTEPYFAEGVADELITELSRVRGMEVTGRASSFALSGDHATPAEATRELGATLVLTGSVRRLPGSVRVNAELVEAPSGRSLWSQAFERPASEVFALQRDIAIRVAQQADARVTSPEPRGVDAEAYRLYLQGRELQLSRTTSDWDGVRDLYRSAVDRDPRFAQAWAALARAEANVASQKVDSGAAGTFFTDAMLAPSLDAAKHAIALDNSFAEPFLVQALAYTWLGRWRQAADAVAAAEKRGGLGGNFDRALGYMQKAQEARKRSTRLDPLSALEWNNLAYTCEYNSDETCHLEAARRAHELAPQDISALRGLVRALIASQKSDEAVALMKQAGWLTKPSTANRQLLYLAGRGQEVGAAEIIAGVRSDSEYVDTAVGYLADASRWKDAAGLIDRWGKPELATIFTLFRKQWAPLRKTPQFWALMKREGLVAYWHDSGRWPDFCDTDKVCEPYR